jgi:hypothetical protein
MLVKIEENWKCSSWPIISALKRLRQEDLEFELHSKTLPQKERKENPVLQYSSHILRVIATSDQVLLPWAA